MRPIKPKSKKSKPQRQAHLGRTLDSMHHASLYFVGKGVTYDTGGADVKYDGHMRGTGLLYTENTG